MNDLVLELTGYLQETGAGRGIWEKFKGREGLFFDVDFIGLI
jgi:hypothetical protein